MLYGKYSLTWFHSFESYGLYKYYIINAEDFIRFLATRIHFIYTRISTISNSRLTTIYILNLYPRFFLLDHQDIYEMPSDESSFTGMTTINLQYYDPHKPWPVTRYLQIGIAFLMRSGSAHTHTHDPRDHRGLADLVFQTLENRCDCSQYAMCVTRADTWHYRRVVNPKKCRKRSGKTAENLPKL